MALFFSWKCVHLPSVIMLSTEKKRACQYEPRHKHIWSRNPMATGNTRFKLDPFFLQDVFLGNLSACIPPIDSLNWSTECRAHETNTVTQSTKSNKARQCNWVLFLQSLVSYSGKKTGLVQIIKSYCTDLLCKCSKNLDRAYLVGCHSVLLCQQATRWPKMRQGDLSDTLSCHLGSGSPFVRSKAICGNS